MDSALRGMVRGDGTPALISYLRDSCPVPPSPPPREWKNVISQAEREAIMTDSKIEVFSVLCYKILCKKYATERSYWYAPAWALSWDYQIFAEIIDSDADFLCLQGVDGARYEEYFLQHLAQQNYEGIYWPKSRAKTMNETDKRLVDGCATFYKSDK